MGCTIVLIRPEHSILDHCGEICRLANSYPAIGIGDARSIDDIILSELLKIQTIAYKCEALPLFILREVRHASETINFKLPNVYVKLKPTIDSLILAIRKKSLSMSQFYECSQSPNSGKMAAFFEYSSVKQDCGIYSNMTSLSSSTNNSRSEHVKDAYTSMTNLESDIVKLSPSNRSNGISSNSACVTPRTPRSPHSPQNVFRRESTELQSRRYQGQSILVSPVHKITEISPVSLRYPENESPDYGFFAALS